jgi:hypothetical protein
MRRLLISLALAGCTDEPAPSGPNVTSHVSSYELPASNVTPLDLLFVVGDTANYDVSSIPGIVDTTLAHIYDGFPDVHIATTSSPDVLELKVDLFGQHTQTFTGSLGDALATRLGPGDSRVLARMQTAIDFTRDNAYLAVIAITGVDDTSADASYAGMVKSTKADPSAVIVSGIYKRPAPRLDAFLAEFPNRNAFTSIDSGDFAPAFAQLSQLQRSTLGLACVPLPLDLDPDTAGDQIDCAVSAYDGTTEVSRIPACDGRDPTSGSCWEVVANVGCSEAGTGELALRGQWRRFHPKVQWQCVTH